MTDDNQHTSAPVDQGDDGQMAMVDTEVIAKKKAAVRRKLAVLLMSVGGTLAAAAIWFGLYSRD